MRKIFYLKLAVSGMYKNRKTYLPYLLTCIGMVMMYYIIGFLTTADSVATMKGGGEMQMILGFGQGVIAVFALIFLFYTNSFLIRRRKKEFGLYNILGMGKWNLFRVMFWEGISSALVALVGGLFCGVLLSKVAELCMAKILVSEATFAFSVEVGVIGRTLVLFALIFGLILLNNVRQIYVAKPVELMRSEASGEKPPKANWLGALLGLLLLGGAYYLAVTIQDPLAAMMIFFVAVIMVIIGTYLLFIAGSVVLCRLLQKQKRYYYQTSHFVSVSSMVFRMKRNGAGLASICILSTMVLVMISSTACLFVGKETNMRARYPRDIVIDTYSMEPKDTAAVQEQARAVLEKRGALAENTLHYRYLDVSGYMEENSVLFDIDQLEDFHLSGYEHIVQLRFIPLSDYNELSGSTEHLESGEVFLYSPRKAYHYDTLLVQGCQPMTIKKKLAEFIQTGDAIASVVTSLYVVLPDLAMEEVFEVQAEIYGENSSYKHDFYGFDLNCTDEEKVALYKEISAGIEQLQIADQSFPMVKSECRVMERSGFYALYGGMFFLGILLGLVFLLAAALIIYYKQISEGYEDQSRFDIMQKVGMTKREIRKSVNSQVLTIFFLPLLMAGVHLMFAFPIVLKLLLIFGLADQLLLIWTAAGCYLLFTVFYVLVYRITSGSYYGIITSRD